MEEAKRKLNEGNLSGALESALAFVKSHPTDISARTFLFELSLFSGDWDRADRQLDAVGHQDANAAMGSLIYRQTLAVEKTRLEYFAKGTRPEFITSCPKYVEDLISANTKFCEGNFAEATKLLDKVEQKRPAFSSKINGESAGDFRDFNDLTSCVFEAFHKDQYIWLPFEHVKKIEFFERKSLRDIFWIQAKVDLSNGLGGEVLVPSLYANSFKSSDDNIRLGRTNDWQEKGEGIFVGEGVKLFSANGESKAISEFETIEFS
jgi:type VI secretion system protein ImpE